MAKFFIALFGALGLIAATPASAAPEDPSFARRTDADLVTAVDVSGSIDGEAEWLELAGIADAIEHPAVLRAIGEGFYGRVGFIAFTWSSFGEFFELVPWTEIGSAADAHRIAERLRALDDVPRMGYRPSTDRPLPHWRRNLATDMSAALDHALLVLAATPFHAERRLINLCANGEDNVGGGPDQARDRAAAQGVTINGVVLGRRDDLADYLRGHVQTGAGSFVIQAEGLGDVTDAMLRKFLMEIAWLRFY